MQSLRPASVLVAVRGLEVTVIGQVAINGTVSRVAAGLRARRRPARHKRVKGRSAMFRRPSTGIAIVVSLGILVPARGEDGPTTCTTCHVQQTERLEASVHHMLVCHECHDGEDSYNVSPELARRYAKPPQAGVARPMFDHGPSFTGKPLRTKIPNLCGDCHSNVERMNPYGLRTDQLAAYWTSGHGKALKERGEQRVAVCTDCHGAHNVLRPGDPASGTNPMNVPGTCGTCHGDPELMAEFDLPVEITDEYRRSVHGSLLFDQGDTGAPTCATCHGNHAATPPGFATVTAVCGQCHRHAAMNFSKSIHADLPEHKGCVQCHGGGEDRHFHLIERITKPAGVMIQRYAHLLTSEPAPSAAQVTEAIHPDPRKIMEHALPSCMECHDDIEDDESLPKLFVLLDEIAKAEHRYVETARRLDRVAQGVLLVDAQRFLFEDAKTHLIELAPLQHTLDNSVVGEHVEELNAVCAQVNAELDKLENGLRWRYRALFPIWLFALLFAGACYAKYKRLKALHVGPFPPESNERQ